MNVSLAAASRLGLALREFFVWWGTALRGFVPASWRRAGRDRRERLVLELGRDEAILRHRGRSQETVLFRGAVHELEPTLRQKAKGLARQVIVTVAETLVFRRVIRLPLSAESSLGRLIGHEIARQTPFTADQVYFDYRIVDRDMAARQLAVELVVAKRVIVDDLKKLALRAGLTLAAARVPATDPGGEPLDLLARHRSDVARSSPVWWNAGLATTATALAVALVTTSLQHLDDEVAWLSVQVREARSQAQQADALRREIGALADTGGFLARRKNAPSALALLREVTTLLPDDAWTYEFQLTDGQLRIVGHAADAPGLIARLQGSTLLRDPRFRAPVTRIANRDIDRFDLAIDVRPAGGQQ